MPVGELCEKDENAVGRANGRYYQVAILLVIGHMTSGVILLIIFLHAKAPGDEWDEP